MNLDNGWKNMTAWQVRNLDVQMTKNFTYIWISYSNNIC